MTQPLVKGSLAKLVTNTGTVATGIAWMMFNQDLMRVVGLGQEKVLLIGKPFYSMEAQYLPKNLGDLHFQNPIEPAWANSAKGRFGPPGFTATY